MPNPGKISSLPHDLREQLNGRLRDNQLPQDILLWLNALPTVRAILAQRFQGRPITGDNLSEYKLHGPYDQWLRHQRACELALSLCDPESPQAPLLANASPELLDRWRFIDILADATDIQAEPDPHSRSLARHRVRTDISSLQRDKVRQTRLQIEQKRLDLQQAQAQQSSEAAHWEWTKRPDVRAKLYGGLAPDTMALIDRDRGVTPPPATPNQQPPKT